MLLHLAADPADDQVTVKGFGTFTFRAWLNLTDLAIASHATRQDSPMTREWLRANGILSKEDALHYLRRRPLFDTPGDWPRVAWCRKCGARITAKISLATGLGACCRRKKA